MLLKQLYLFCDGDGCHNKLLIYECPSYTQLHVSLRHEAAKKADWIITRGNYRRLAEEKGYCPDCKLKRKIP